ncbi:hypothetical protein OR221_0125 [Microbacterium laevaniformans OR221]|nr:hypothetical protein OR221_0125 [Microbacterium laevaniformans OR221]
MARATPNGAVAPDVASAVGAAVTVTAYHPITAPEASVTARRCAAAGASVGTVTAIVPAAETVAVPRARGVENSHAPTEPPARSVPTWIDTVEPAAMVAGPENRSGTESAWSALPGP